MKRDPLASLDTLKFTDLERAEILVWFHTHDVPAKAPEAPTAEQVPLPIGDFDPGPNRKQRKRDLVAEEKARLASETPA
jgi:hypothetical protein